MFYATTADVIEVRHLLFACKITHLFDHLCRLDVLVGSRVVGHQSNFFRVKHVLAAHAVKLIYSDGSSDIVCQHQIKLACDKLTWLHMVYSGGPRQQLFGYGHGFRH